MEAFANSDIGKVRDMNQDSYYISDKDDKIKLYIVLVAVLLSASSCLDKYPQEAIKAEK